MTTAPEAPACSDSRATAVTTDVIDSRHRQRAWALTALTIGWNAIEAVVAIASGVVASSVALIGFGLGSVIEVSSALVVVWLLTHRFPDHAARERTERVAVRLVAVSFGLMAAYVVADSAAKLLGVSLEPEESLVGLALVALSVVVMPLLAWAKRRVAIAMNSVTVQADSAQTQLCTYMSVVALIGLAANAAFGWWWMDPLAGIGVAAIAVREGVVAWRSGELCQCD
ncbi:MAG: cation transporter [Dehalococcoidia bacterium]|nr:cation transporter [Dehalococcoidia bacterium]